MKLKLSLVGGLLFVLTLGAYLLLEQQTDVAARSVQLEHGDALVSEYELPTDLESLIGREVVVARSVSPDSAHVPIPLAELDLDSFGACLEARDDACLRDFILDWYQSPAQGVDRLLELLPQLQDGDHGMLLALLLKSAMVMMANDPESFQPWDGSSLIASCVSLADANPFMSSLLYTGLADFGASAKSEDFDTILNLYGGVAESQFNEPMNQLDQMRLLGAWIRDLPEEEVQRFKASYTSHDLTDSFYHGMGARFLVERDLESGIAFVAQAMLDVTSGYDPQDPFVAEYENMMNIGLGAAFGPNQPDKRGELLMAFDGSPGLLSAYIAQMDEGTLQEAASYVDPSRLDPAARSLLELCRAGPESDQAVLDLLHSEDRDALDEVAATRVWKEAIERGFLSDYHESVQREFESRSLQPGVFWSRIRTLAGNLDSEDDVVEAILPWVEDSAGETSPWREAVIRDLRQRFQSMDWLR